MRSDPVTAILNDELPTAAPNPLTDLQPRDISFAEAIGQAAWLMSYSPTSRFFFVSDLQWSLIPAISLKQFKLYQRDGKPIGFVSWAFLSDDVEARFLAGEKKLRPDEWQSGQNAWLFDLVAPFGASEKIIEDLRRTVFARIEFSVMHFNSDVSGVERVKWKGLELSVS